MATYNQIGETIKSWVSQEERRDFPQGFTGLAKRPLVEQMSIMDHRLPDYWGEFKRKKDAAKQPEALLQLLRMVYATQLATIANDVIDGLDITTAKHKSLAVLSRHIKIADPESIKRYQYDMPYGYAMDVEPYFPANRQEIIPKVSRRILEMTMQYTDIYQFREGFFFPAPAQSSDVIEPWDPHGVFFRG